MTQLLDLPEEIILEIITQFLDIPECIHLVQTCRAMHKFTRLKVFWVAIARWGKSYRPIALPEDWSRHSPEKIKDIILGSMRLGKMLEGPRIDQPSRIWTLDANGEKDEKLEPGGAIMEDVPTEKDPQLWVWLLSDGVRLMSMSQKGMLRLWDMNQRKIITAFDVEGLPLCWDYTDDADGITIIVNIGDIEEESDTFRVWRYEWASSHGEQIFTKVIPGDIRSNYIEGDLAGCVGNTEEGPTYIYLLNWRTFEDAYIETPFRLPQNLSAATSPDTLFIYAEDTNHALYYSYTFSLLSSRLTRPDAEKVLVPTDIRRCHFTNSYLDAAEAWVPTCRQLWDGRTGVFSRGMVNDDFQAGFVTLSLLQLETSGPAHAAKLEESGRRKPKDGDFTRVERKLVHLIKEGGIVTAPPSSDWDLCSMGTFGKTVCWMEYEPGPWEAEEEEGEQKIGRLCFAEWPAVDGAGELDEKDDSSDGGSVIVTVGDESSVSADNGASVNGTTVNDVSVNDVELPTEQEAVEALVDFLLADDPAPIPITNGQDNDEEIEELDLEAVPDSSSNGPFTTVPRQEPVVSGHVCELPMPSDWAKEHGGIYTVDFDDARGRLAFATGSGKILIWELL